MSLYIKNIVMYKKYHDISKIWYIYHRYDTIYRYRKWYIDIFNISNHH